MGRRYSRAGWTFTAAAACLACTNESVLDRQGGMLGVLSRRLVPTHADCYSGERGESAARKCALCVTRRVDVTVGEQLFGNRDEVPGVLPPNSPKAAYRIHSESRKKAAQHAGDMSE